MRKWARRTGIACLLLLLLLPCGLLSLFATQNGTRLILACSEYFFSPSLHIGSSKGSFLYQLQLNDVSWSNQNSGRIEIKTLLLHWRSQDLLKRHLHIVELSTTGLRYTAPLKETQAQTATATTLPDLILPISISIDRLHTEDTMLYAAKNKAPLQIDNLDLSALWEKAGITLKNFSVQIPHLNITARGTLSPTENYSINLETTLQTQPPDYPAVKIYGKYKGDTKKLSIQEQFTGDIRGALAATMQDLLTTPSWKASFSRIQCNSKLFQADIPGEITGTIESMGNVHHFKTTAQLAMQDNNKAMFNWDGSVDIDTDIQTSSLQINKCTLSQTNGPASIDLAGIVSMEQDFDIKMRWQDLQWPLTQEAQYKANAGQLRIKGNVDNHRLIPPGHKFRKSRQAAQLSFNFNTSLSTPTTPEATVQLISHGSLMDHLIDIDIHAPTLADLSLALHGRYQTTNDRWQATVHGLRLSTQELGIWQNREEADLHIGKTAAELSQLCINHDGAALCLQGNWDKEGKTTTGNISLKDFSLHWLSPWFPQHLDDLQGMLSIEAKALQKEKLNASVVGKITPGTIHYSTPQKQGILDHQGAAFSLELEGQEVQSSLFVSVDSNRIEAELHSPDMLNSDQNHSPTLAGTIHVDAPNFTLAKSLVDEIERLQAKLEADFSVSGKLFEPNINGQGTFTIADLFIPAIGCELQESSFALVASKDTISTTGNVNGVVGFMTLDGNLLLNKEKRYPAELTLHAENFKLINLPEIQIFLNSDLSYKSRKDINLLSGTLEIPQAEVLLKTLPQGTESVSPDIVISNTEKKEEPKSPVAMALQIILGKEVFFAGFGANGFIDGKLHITAKPDEQMLGSGEFHIREGSYRAYGQDLDIENGVISFPGGPLSQPGISFRASKTIGDVVAGLAIIGPATKPQITPYSRPPMPKSQILSYLLTGSPPGAGGARLSVGRQINNKLSVAIATDTKTGEKEFISRYRLNRKIHVEASTGSGRNGAEIVYSTEFGGENEPEQPDTTQ